MKTRPRPLLFFVAELLASVVVFLGASLFLALCLAFVWLLSLRFPISAFRFRR
ncbi:MAG: hypothetical protein M3Y03_04795 [Verrucomicrobiota bacterium]|nr:hypothetical protein [Verrucomicrobiota bacterium]